MVSINRGDVFLVDFNPTIGAETRKTRLAVVVSNNINNTHSPIVSVAPITSNIARIYSFEVKVKANLDGLSTTSKIMVNQTRAVDKTRLLKNLGTLPNDIIQAIDKALKLHFSLWKIKTGMAEYGEPVIQ